MAQLVFFLHWNNIDWDEFAVRLAGLWGGTLYRRKGNLLKCPAAELSDLIQPSNNLKSYFPLLWKAPQTPTRPNCQSLRLIVNNKVGAAQLFVASIIVPAVSSFSFCRGGAFHYAHKGGGFVWINSTRKWRHFVGLKWLHSNKLPPMEKHLLRLSAGRSGVTSLVVADTIAL